MDAGSFAHYLAGLNAAALTELLRARPDALVEPVPRGFAQLAQRLGGPDSLAAALRTTNRDGVVVGQAVVALGAAASVAGVARMFDVLSGTPSGAVEAAVADLCARGLAWTDSRIDSSTDAGTGSGRLRLPERLAAHWSAEIGGGRPAAAITRTMLVDDARATAEALGVPVAGLRKPELAARVTEVLADVPALAATVAALPKPLRDRLDRLRRRPDGSDLDYYTGHGGARPRPTADADRRLAAAGLLLRSSHGYELPKECAVAGWLAGSGLTVTGPPDIPRSEGAVAATRRDSQAAVQALLQAVTAMLDQARTTPIAALKKGGVGARERTRLADRLSLAADVVVLAIDLAYAAGLLGLAEAGYAPTGAYPDWRAAEPADQWARLVTAWYRLEHAPTSRDIQGDKELPPPLPLASAAGMIRRALLRAGAAGAEVSAVGAQLDWFCPLHGYDDAQREDKIAAAVREAGQLGVIATDRVTEYGEHLLAATDDDADHMAAALAERVAALLPAAPGSVILQSDLTAVVSGTPGASTARLLAAAAVSEARGPAGVWRFTPASVRAALDSGWAAGELLAELAALTSRPLPQPLEYLINDVARRHGQVRVRALRSCVLADEATIAELLHTRSLARLHLAGLAPTVLASPVESDEVLARLRAAGFSPVAEDAQGAVVVQGRAEHSAPPAATTAAARRRLPAGELAARLLADPHGDAGLGARSGTVAQLAALNPELADMELELLADAVDNVRDVLITYRDKNGSRTVREIRPREVYGRWLDSWCHLRNADREFTVANIESVAPPA